MKPPGPCRECTHEDFPYPACRCTAAGCWCPVSGVDPLDLDLPEPRARQQAIDLDAVLPGGGSHD